MNARMWAEIETSSETVRIFLSMHMHEIEKQMVCVCLCVRGVYQIAATRESPPEDSCVICINEYIYTFHVCEDDFHGFMACVHTDDSTYIHTLICACMHTRIQTQMKIPS